MTSNCQTTLAPGVAWPPFKAGINHAALRAVGLNTINQRGQDDIKAIVSAINHYGSCSTSRLMKHTGLARQRINTALNRIIRTQYASVGVVRVDALNNLCTSKIYGFLS